MAGSILCDVLVAQETDVFGNGNTHCVRYFRTVLNVTGHAVACIQYRDPVGIARVGKLGLGVIVLRGFQRVSMTTLAGLLHRIRIGVRPGVAGVAGELNLVVAAAGGTW